MFPSQIDIVPDIGYPLPGFTLFQTSLSTRFVRLQPLNLLRWTKTFRPQVDNVTTGRCLAVVKMMHFPLNAHGHTCIINH
jgi:hypothetical protein